MTCPYVLELSDEEADAMDWLSGVLAKVRDKAGGNAGKAAAAIRALTEVQRCLILLHRRSHALDELLETMQNAGKITIDGVDVKDLMREINDNVRPEAKA